MLNLSNKTSPMKSSSVNFIQSKEFESRLDKHLENKISINKFVMSSIHSRLMMRLNTYVLREVGSGVV